MTLLHVAKNLKVTARRSPGEIGCLMFVSFFSINGVTLPRRP